MKRLLIIALFPLLLALGSCSGGYYGVSTGPAYPYYGPAYGGYYRSLPPYAGYHGGYHNHGGWGGYHGGGGYYGGHAGGNWGGGGHYGGGHHH